MNRPCATAASVSPSASFIDLPVSTCTQYAISSRCARSAMASSCKIVPRRTGGIAPHSGCARRAAATAAATSAPRERLTRYSARPSLGACLTKYSSPAAGCGSPAIQLRTTSILLRSKIIVMSPSGEAAIDAKFEAGDIRRGTRSQKHQRPHQVARLRHAAEQHARTKFLYDHRLLADQHAAADGGVIEAQLSFAGLRRLGRISGGQLRARVIEGRHPRAGREQCFDPHRPKPPQGAGHYRDLAVEIEKKVLLCVHAYVSILRHPQA